MTAATPVSRLLRLACGAAVLGAAIFAWPAAATAVAPPTIDPGALAAAQALAGRAAPPDPTEPKSLCAEPTLVGAPPRDVPIAQQVLDLPTAWKFSTGAGQKVAVIDTGVTRHPRLPALQAGGDYVSDGDGTFDCDGHGTLVAGIIAAQPGPDDAFAGVAPGAEILSIRQLSQIYDTKGGGGQKPPGAMAEGGYGTVLTLAAAVVRAVDMGATVINISEVACAPAGSDTADAPLGAAIKYAYDRNVVVVAAAGNLQQGGACEKQNTGTGWDSVHTVATPAWFSPYVLTVGSVDPDGKPSDLSLHGPWIGVAAIGRKIVSLDSKRDATGLVNGVQTQEGMSDIQGTSFAAPYAAGLAALVRARYPELSAAQVIDRILRTSHGPGSGHDDRVGHGLIDPVAALTAELPETPIGAAADVPKPIAAPVWPPGPDPRPRRIAVVGSITCLVALGIGVAVAIPFRRRSHDDADPNLD
ncbi:membrane-anchored mycosin MYCP [Nocardia transvalensis]|uniref:Membrane-anchored mycosin MYCP n=1 Tax=Nocardia transvalensis TaxID=37333 RepID=A0A7W9PC08_9NOCA|nr:type VII secretion-associated serine protease mycosin [Nocardia transvalensis]MBB5912839.1 membrane-anchored mycosin MYCP [Nocardia transvalensis]